MVVSYLLSINPKKMGSFPNVIITFNSVQTMIERGVFFKDIQSSLISVTVGVYNWLCTFSTGNNPDDLGFSG